MRKVEDYELMNNFEIIYQFPVIIYGAGEIGYEVCMRLEELGGIKIEAFCDARKMDSLYCGKKVINVEELADCTKEKVFNIIVSSIDYSEEMLNEINKREIKNGHVFTYWGLDAAIACNLTHPNVNKEFGRNYTEEVQEWWRDYYVKKTLRRTREAMVKNVDVLVYQYRKVGSSTINKSLSACGIKCEQLHILTDDRGLECVRTVQERYRQKVKEKGVKIICLVREPIIRYISELMHASYISKRAIYYTEPGLIDNLKKGLLDDLHFCKEWFDKELKYFSGIDVLSLPFDKEQGYSIYREGKVELLLLTLEKLRDNEKVIGQFVGDDNFVLIDDNVTSTKISKYTYEDIKKEFKISTEMMEMAYREFPVEHFYTDEDIIKFKNKWTR